MDDGEDAPGGYIRQEDRLVEWSNDAERSWSRCHESLEDHQPGATRVAPAGQRNSGGRRVPITARRTAPQNGTSKKLPGLFTEAIPVKRLHVQTITPEQTPQMRGEGGSTTLPKAIPIARWWGGGAVCRRTSAMQKQCATCGAVYYEELAGVNFDKCAGRSDEGASTAQAGPGLLNPGGAGGEAPVFPPKLDFRDKPRRGSDDYRSTWVDSAT